MSNSGDKEIPESKSPSGENQINPESEPENDENTQLRRSKRKNIGIPPDRFSYYECNTVFEPKSWKDLNKLSSQEKENWYLAAAEEIKSHQVNNTWVLEDLPPGKKAVGCRCVFKAKCNSNGAIERYKARLVAKGYTQNYGEDYDEIFAPVVNPVTVRLLVTIAAARNLKVKHFDVKTAFLNENLHATT